MAGSRGELYHLAAQPVHKGRVLRFGIADDYIVVGQEEHVYNFTLCSKGFPLPGVPKNRPLGLLSRGTFFRRGKGKKKGRKTRL